MSEIALPKIDSSILNRKSEIVKKLSKLTNIENVLSEADELRPYETDALSVIKDKILSARNFKSLSSVKS